MSATSRVVAPNRTNQAMRPILTLKKKPAPDPLASVAIPGEPAKPVEPAKAAKQSPMEAKEARAAANRLLGQELSARRRACTEKVKPLLESYFADKAILRETIVVFRRRPHHLTGCNAWCAYGS